MVLTTVLLFLTMREIWRWTAAIVTAGIFVIVVSANMMKVLGWIPLVVAALVFFLMYTWWRGRRGLLGCWNATPSRLEASSPRLMTRRGCAVPPFM